MKKPILLLLVLALTLGLAACGSSTSTGAATGAAGETSTTDAAAETAPAAPALTEVSGTVVSASLPEGWKLMTAEEIGSSMTDSDFIIKGSSYDPFSTPYLQVQAAYSGTIEQYQEWIAGGSFGDPLDPMTLGGVTWYAGKEGAAAQLGDKLCLVYNVNGAAFTDSEVQAILGSLAWIE